ncbi:MAG TPA: PRD domain-containing protein [Candidatus Anaerostipes avistercoris]|uniref:PRD domain-containing protein n=1 Tax=Candidatus Anaerostipes avistercoris TaxID=2838462 RepID=A0A9D2PFT3_9FIRM|nr:PRD domain-containing protein [Candidatus Anaerostipes avistercoris]
MELFNNENRISSILKNIEMQSVCSVEKLAGKLNVSAKTIRNDIKELNYLLGGYAMISMNKGDCKLIVFDQKGFQEIRNKIFQQDDFFNSPQTRMTYLFWQLINAEEPYLTDDLSEEMKVGRTTAISDLNKLRKIIGKYQLKIKGKANTGLKLVGDELHIRLFILENIYEQLYLNFPLGAEVREKLSDFQKKLSLDALGFGFFYRFFVVMIQRIESGHVIQELDEKYMDLYQNQAYSIVDEFLDEIENVKAYEIPKEERIFLCISVAGMRTPANTREIEQKISVSEDVADMIIEMLDRIHTELDVTVIANELFDDFVYHIFFMINRLKYGLHIHNPMIDDFKNQYSVAYKMAEIGKEVIEKREGITITEDEMAFLAAYFGVFLIEQEPEEKRCRIAIVCGSGKIIGRLIENQLKRIFDVEPEFEFFYNGNFAEHKKNTFDYIVTTTELNLETETPVIFMDEVFDKEYIQKKFHNIKYLADAGHDIRRGIDSLFMNLLDENRFFILNQEKSYDENVRIMAETLMSQGELDTEFADRVEKREKYSTMILNQNIAFPHTRNMLPKLSLALGVYPKPPKEKGYEEVKLVILLGIPESMEDDTVLVRLYDEILMIGKDVKVIDKIRSMKSYKELLLYITEENNIFK